MQFWVKILAWVQSLYLSRSLYIYMIFNILMLTFPLYLNRWHSSFVLCTRLWTMPTSLVSYNCILFIDSSHCRQAPSHWTVRELSFCFEIYCYFCMWASWLLFSFFFFLICVILSHMAPTLGFPGGSVIKIASVNSGATGDMGSIPELGRYFAGGNGSLVQCSCLGNPMGRGAWQTTVHGISKTGAKLKGLSTHTCMSPTFIVVWILQYNCFENP